jgi:cytochrome c biogenesis protein CcdA
MLEVIFYLAGSVGSLWLAVVAVDAIVAAKRREWRFSIRRLLLVTAVLSLVLGVLVTSSENNFHPTT